MKVYEIALFILLIQVSIAFFNATGIFGATMVADTEYTNQINNTYQGATFSDSPVAQDNVSWDFWGVLKSIFYFGSVFLLGVALPPYVLVQFGIPLSLACIVSVPIFLIYIVGLIQLIRGVGFEGMK